MRVLQAILEFVNRETFLRRHMNIAGKQRCTTFRVKWKTGYGYLVFNPFFMELRYINQITEGHIHA